MHKKLGVPVLMFHSIRPEGMIDSPLSVPLKVFTRNMEALVQRGYKTITMQELYNYVSGTVDLPEKVVVLTFDDGFLDNWIYVFPVLKELGLKAVIFPTIDFIGDGPQREYYRYPEKGSLPECRGSVRWSELQEMHDSSVFDVQSHTMTHTWLFSGPGIVDIFNGKNMHKWLAWNLHPEKKSVIFDKDSSGLVPLGYPVFENGRALGVREFIPDKAFVDELSGRFAARKEAGDIDSSSWKLELEQYKNEWIKDHGSIGRLETVKEQQDRIITELCTSRSILEKKLNKEVKFLCWPGGARSEIAKSLTGECGYIATTERGTNVNKPGENPARIRRMGSFSLWTYKGLRGWIGPRYFVELLERYKGNARSAVLCKIYKVGYILGALLRRTRSNR
ncbi:MAG: polysaccharide deacetylase family protein [Candidatus Sabulitectum sp.]|nr:polysaccharide deacetylase family protein [Candidatus Sabulitectum sp.]